jgi:hypothetical protein
METLICNLKINEDLSSNYVSKNGFLMLPYTEEKFAQQPLSSRVTNINPFLVVKWDGIMDVNPPSDEWVEIINLDTVFKEKTDEIIVNNYIPCPAPYIVSSTTSVSSSYGGWYGEIVGRAGDAGGVDYWINDSKTQTIEQIAASWAKAAVINGEKLIAPVSASALLSLGNVLTSTTNTTYNTITYSDGSTSTQAVSSVTSGVNVTGQTFSY